jgi:hypothetical protein
VGPRHIKKSAVERSKIKNNAVDSSKILDNAVSGADIKESTLEKVPAATLADKAASAAGVDRVVYRSARGVSAGSPGGTATAACDPGLRVIGGGVSVDDPLLTLLTESFPVGGGVGWTARVESPSSLPGVGFTAYAICVPAAAIG